MEIYTKGSYNITRSTGRYTTLNHQLTSTLDPRLKSICHSSFNSGHFTKIERDSQRCWKCFPLITLFFWPCYAAYGILASGPGNEPMPSAMGEHSLNHWTTRNSLLITLIEERNDLCRNELVVPSWSVLDIDTLKKDLTMIVQTGS